MVRMGTKLRDGFDAQASSHGVGIRSTGPAQMPNLAFEDDTAAYERRWCSPARARVAA